MRTICAFRSNGCLLGFVLDILWSGVQALAFYTPLLKKVTVTHWQRLFSMRELVKTNRVSGMAYEPAWLAGQIATVYLPWLFASLLTGVRVTRFKWFEIILLVFASLLLLATYSRGGLLTAVFALVLTFLIAGRRELARGLEMVHLRLSSSGRIDFARWRPGHCIGRTGRCSLLPGPKGIYLTPVQYKSGKY